MNFTDNNDIQPSHRFGIITPLLWLEKFLTSGISWAFLLFCFFLFFLLLGFTILLGLSGVRGGSILGFYFLIIGRDPAHFVWLLSMPNLFFLLLFVLFRRTRLGVFFRDFFLTFLVLSTVFCCFSFLSYLIYRY